MQADTYRDGGEEEDEEGGADGREGDMEDEENEEEEEEESERGGGEAARERDENNVKMQIIQEDEEEDRYPSAGLEDENVSQERQSGRKKRKNSSQSSRSGSTKVHRRSWSSVCRSERESLEGGALGGLLGVRKIQVLLLASPIAPVSFYGASATASNCSSRAVRKAPAVPPSPVSAGISGRQNEPSAPRRSEAPPLCPLSRSFLNPPTVNQTASVGRAQVEA
uniref:Uncharacterized protein n=1 Tax=Chromera velia CCMP2878 TaxID=1169474 RepID=A0A0G4IFB1_9ALVE|eukprot:Cvel_13833.t1-p1 / transcript=Cvel_13833.t1 / gene=Cvel_13833 / organism=Chromera_velia_CCMP2878 / gene_product=hypothetical protein / transcript_product=hypothetical protein / location=Cvel_scaffold960:53518-54183(-) / protein_length=222 / sequence_SO=supercontig / SO=protein_coding / is_pseudo=false